MLNNKASFQREEKKKKTRITKKNFCCYSEDRQHLQAKLTKKAIRKYVYLSIKGYLKIINYQRLSFSTAKCFYH